VIALNERQLRRVINSYVSDFQEDRTHLGLEKDTPIPRVVEPPSDGKIVALPRFGGLLHRYSREEKMAAWGLRYGLDDAQLTWSNLRSYP
jgi:hypothetical protein